MIPSLFLLPIPLYLSAPMIGGLLSSVLTEVADISFMQALHRILTLAADQLRQLGAFCEKTATAFFDAIMETALQCVGFSKNNMAIT